MQKTEQIISSDNSKLQRSFSAISLDRKLIQVLEVDMKYSSMTVVQDMTIEILLSGKDLHILSRTGSGKTAAFLVPSIQHLISARQPRKSIKLLCISPTRELALQIAKEAEMMSKKLSFRVGVAIGGTNIKAEERAIDSGIDILIATPGRLLDHLSKNTSLLDGVSILVLDECDRLLDMGFGPDVNKIMAFAPKQRQSILCSATTSPAINSIVSSLLKPNHETVSTILKGESNVHEKIPQYHFEADFVQQINLLVTLVEANYNREFKAVVFCQTAHLANLVHAVLSNCPSFKKSANCFVQHSRQSQSARTKVTQKFKDCTIGVLVATDVVARGMDFPLVSHVFQIGVDSVETYIHRVGRTGRNGAEGQGFLILAPQERYLLPLLRKMNIPIETNVIEISSRPFILEAIAGFCKDTENAKKVYQSWLGYYNSQKGMNLDKSSLIHSAQDFAKNVLGCSEPPPLEKKTVGKMGLSAYSNLLCGTEESKKNRKRPSNTLRVPNETSSSRSSQNDRLTPNISKANVTDIMMKISSESGARKHTITKAGKAGRSAKPAANNIAEKEKSKPLCKFYPNCKKGEFCTFTHPV